VHIFTAHARNGYRSFRPRNSLRQRRFPIRQMYFHYRVTFTGHIRCFCATNSHDLVTLTFDLLTLRMFRVQCFSCPTRTPIFIILRLSVTELWVTEFDHISVNRHWHCHCACAVSRDLSSGGKNGPHFWNPWPKLTYSLCHFHGATTKIKPCYMRKIAFIPLSNSMLQSSLRMRSIAWPVHRGSPKTTRNNFLTPTYLFTIHLLWGYDDD